MYLANKPDVFCCYQRYACIRNQNYFCIIYLYLFKYSMEHGDLFLHKIKKVYLPLFIIYNFSYNTIYRFLIPLVGLNWFNCFISNTKTICINPLYWFRNYWYWIREVVLVWLESLEFDLMD